MPISALSQETVRLLGSPLVYSTPLAVVKELVDNAIDAHATAVEVYISANTVDSVEVRDNGHGVHPDDFSSLGRRGCTSKLRTFEDIQTVGGVTLGFRGDALASAANLSTLQIVTRTAGEPIASKLYFSEKGGVERIERVAGPVGTAVRATRLFARLPVRRQVALKEAIKTLSKIKELLHSYAFARPHIRLALRVLNHPKVAWSYAPGPHPSMRQAALQVFGAELVSQCVDETNNGAEKVTQTPSSGLTSVFKAHGSGVYEIEALLPNPGADPTKISKGAWFSVDSRPVTCNKGTIKTLYTAFKTHLTPTLASTGCTTTPKTPFLAVNIKCPPKSYDPNVEPSKDEVLFANSHRLVEAFEQLVKTVYSTAPPSTSLDTTEAAKRQAKESHQASEASTAENQSSHLPSIEKTSVRSPTSPLIPGTNTPVSSWVQSLTSIEAPKLRSQMATTSPRMTVGDINKLHQGGSHYLTPPSSDDPKPGCIPGQQGSRDTRHLDDPAGQKPRRAWKVNMSSHDDDDSTSVISRRPVGRVDDDTPNNEEQPAKPGQDVNPWIIAKFNAHRIQGRPPPAQPVEQTEQTQLTRDDLPSRSLEASLPGARSALGIRTAVHLNTEGASGQQVSAPILGAVPGRVVQQKPSIQHAPPSARETSPAGSPGGRPALGMRSIVPLDIEGVSQQQLRAPFPASRLHAPGAPEEVFRLPVFSPRSSNAYTSPGEERQTANRHGPRGSMAPYQHGNKAYRKPSSSRQRPQGEEQLGNWFQGSLDFTRKSKRLQRGRPGGSGSADVDGAGLTPTSSAEPDAAFDIGAIRHRQGLAENRTLRERLGERSNNATNFGSSGTISAPMEATVHDPQSQAKSSADKSAVLSGLPSGDPRAYLMRRECSLPATTPRKLRRVKSCMLPLETTPEGEETQSLVQTMQVDVQKLCESDASKHGRYVPDATVDNDMNRRISQTQMEEIQSQVRELLSELGLDETDNDC